MKKYFLSFMLAFTTFVLASCGGYEKKTEATKNEIEEKKKSQDSSLGGY
jgi:predicted small lipoprotein YifL